MLDPNLMSTLQQIAHGLAAQFGPDCEVVLHDLTGDSLEHTVVFIQNGHVSNRKTGDGPSHIVLEALRSGNSFPQDKLAYLTKSHNGKILKSSTMFIRDNDGKICAILAINYDITTLLSFEHTIGALTATEEDRKNEPDEPQPIPLNVADLLDELAEQAIANVGKPVPLMTKEEKVRVVQFLSDSGAFLITKSGDKISNLLGISKYTLYSYMAEGKA